MTTNPAEKSKKELEIEMHERALGEVRELSAQLRNTPKLVVTFYSIWATIMLLIPWFQMSGVPMFSSGRAAFITMALLWFALMAFTSLHELDSPWLKHLTTFFPPGRKPDAADLLRILKTTAENHFVMRVLSLVCGVGVLTFLETFVIDAFQSGGLFQAVATSLVASLAIPTLTSVALMAQRHDTRKRLQKKSQISLTQAESTNVAPRKHSGYSPAKAFNRFLINRAPYLSAYSAFLAFVGLISFLPTGLGHTIAGWLTSCAQDANIAATHQVSPAWATGISALIFFILYSALSPLAVRLCASFQILVARILVNGDNILEALMETAKVKRTVITLPETHVHLRNFTGAMTWLGVCYLAMFSLVAFCPPPLGDAILGWLQASVRDAGMDVDINSHLNLRLFLASIFAGYGAAPVAATTCSFLPGRKPRQIIVSAQGILCPTSAGNLAGLSPLKNWTDLRKVSLIGKGTNQKLRLSFSWCDSMTLRLADFNPQEINELLAAADEYATNCRFSADVIAMRTRLIEQTKSNSVTEAAKFTSTIFSPRSSGDYLHDQYRVVRKLAGKALTAVYLARDPEDKHVVVKEFVLPTNAQQRERMLLTFEREFNILSALHHDGIAQVKDMFEENEARYIVIEYIQGTDLRTIIEHRGHRSEATVWRWAASIAKIMSFLHDQDPPVLHRDLTPDNLMEDADGNIKLIDFGAAHQFMEGVTGTLIGKQCYIAPEQLRGAPSTRSDIYSFGCTLYFFLTGDDPAALRQCELPNDVTVTPQMREMIRKCTAFDETERYQSFEEIIRDLSSQLSLKTLPTDDPSKPVVVQLPQAEEVPDEKA